MPKISVIIPIYNVEQYLDKCIQSVLNQTLTDIEIICVDDCSTDNSYKIAHQYAARDNRIKLLQTPKNSGQSVARNLGMHTASADYFMFCDSDDWYEPTMCQDMLSLIIKNKADLGICSVNVIYEANTNLNTTDKKLQLLDGCFNKDDQEIRNAAVGAPMRIVKKSIIKKHCIDFPEGLKYEDSYFSNVYNLYVKKIATTSKKLYNYRRRAGSTMNITFTKTSKTTLDHAYIAIRYFDYLVKNNFYNDEYFNFWTGFFVSCAQNALMFTKIPQYSKQLDKLLIDFIKTNYKFGTTDSHTDYIMSLILSGKFVRYNKYAFGLVQTYHEKNKNEWCIWKICAFKIKYTDSQIKYYLFGICVYKKDKK